MTLGTVGKVGVSRFAAGKAGASRYRRRSALNIVMLALTGLSALAAVTPLVWVVAYVAQQAAWPMH
jgi:hypothetical protein